MNYIKKRYWVFLVVFFLITASIILKLNVKGTGDRPDAIGPYGPLSWVEIAHLYKKILLGSVSMAIFFTLFDYLYYIRKEGLQKGK